MAQGDFELLSTYITIRTVGLEKVLQSFEKARRAGDDLQRTSIRIGSGGFSRAAEVASLFTRQLKEAQLFMLRIAGSGRVVSQQLTALGILQQRITRLQGQSNLTTSQHIQLQRLLNSIIARREALENRVAAAARQSALVAERAITRGTAAFGQMLRQVQATQSAMNRGVASFGRVIAAARAAQQAQVRAAQVAVTRGASAFGSVIAAARAAHREVVAQTRATNAAIDQGVAGFGRMLNRVSQAQQQVRQLMNSISLELGFAAPFLRLGTNVFRVSQSFRQLARVAGLSAGAIRLAGIAGGVLTVGLSAMNTALNIAGRLMATVARIAGNLLKQAFAVLLGPTLALVRAFRLLVQNLPLVAAGFAALATRSLVNIAQQFQRISSTFQFAFGPRAQQEMEFIRNLAERFGVPLLTIADNYGRIASAARDAGLSQRELQTLFEGTSAAAVALGLDAERVGGLFFAFEQVISKGRLSAEELRRQIGDRLPGAFNIAARAMGVTTQQLDELLRRGAIDSVQFMRAFGQELVRTFSGAAQTAAQRLVATLNRMNNAFLQIGEAVAVRLEPGFVKLINRIIDLTQRIARSSGFESFVNFINQQLEVLDQNFNRIVASIAATWERLRPALERIGKVMFVLNTVAVGALVEGFIRLTESAGGVIGKLEDMTRAVTAIDLDKVTIDVDNFVKILNNIPLILDLVQLRLKAVTLDTIIWMKNWLAPLDTILETLVKILQFTASAPSLRQVFVEAEAFERAARAGVRPRNAAGQFTPEFQAILADVRRGTGAAGEELNRLLTEFEVKSKELAEALAKPLRTPFEVLTDDIAARFFSTFDKVKARAKEVFNELMAGYRRTTAAAGEGIRATTGSGATVSVLASRGTTAVDQTTTIARTTAENTTTLVALTEALNRSIQRLPFDFASVTGIGSVLVRPGGGLNK